MDNFLHKKTYIIGTLHLTYNVSCDAHIYDPARSLGTLTRFAQAISTQAKASSTERVDSETWPPNKVIFGVNFTGPYILYATIYTG
jgi:hypothetical protein